MKVSEVTVLWKTWLCLHARRACGVHLRSLRNLNGEVPSMRIQISLTIHWTGTSDTYRALVKKSLRALKTLSMNFKMTCLTYGWVFLAALLALWVSLQETLLPCTLWAGTWVLSKCSSSQPYWETRPQIKLLANFVHVHNCSLSSARVP